MGTTLTILPYSPSASEMTKTESLPPRLASLGPAHTYRYVAVVAVLLLLSEPSSDRRAASALGASALQLRRRGVREAGVDGVKVSGLAFEGLDSSRDTGAAGGLCGAAMASETTWPHEATITPCDAAREPVSRTVCSNAVMPVL